MKKSENFSIQMKDQFKVIGLCLLLFVACKSKEPELNNPTAPTSQTAPSGADPGLSSVTATIAGPYTANGVDEIIVDVVMKDSFNRPLYEVKPQFNITNTDGKNIIDCTPSNLAGESRCRITSTRAETKSISLSYPFSQFIGTATFVHDPPAYIEIQTQPSTNGVAGNALAQQPVVKIFDEFGNPALSAVNNVTANFYSDSTCTTLSAGTSIPVNRTIAGDGSTATYTFAGLGNQLADIQYIGFTSPGLTPACSHAIDIVNNIVYSLTFDTQPSAAAVAGDIFTQFPVLSIRDQFGNLAIEGGAHDAMVTLTPYRNAACTNLHGVGLPGLAGQSPLTSDNGLTIQANGAITDPFELTMYRSGNLYVQASAPGITSACSSLVSVSADIPDQVQTDFTATTPTAANDFHPSTITATIRDQYRNPAPGTTPTFSTSGTNNTQTACSASNGSGVSTCQLRSTSVELKTITMLTPFNKVTTSNFINPPDVGQSSIVGTGPVTADNVSTSTITITMEDSAGDPVVGIAPTPAATGSGNTFSACSVSNASGISTCTLRSSVAELKTLSTTMPFAMSDGTVLFEPGAVSGANSSITGTGPVTADDVATSTITIILRDQFNNIVPGVTPTFAATDTGATNTYGACSVGDVNGESTCTLRSQRAEVKTLQLLTPDTANGGNVTFEAGLADAGNSSITGTSPVFANGSANSQIEITLIDQFMNPLVGEVPTFSANLGPNNYGACSAADATGVSQCTMSSNIDGIKTLEITSPLNDFGGTVTFEATPLLVLDAGSDSQTYAPTAMDVTHTFTFDNNASHSSGLISVNFVPDNPARWVLTSDGCNGANLAAGASCVIQVTFRGSIGGVGSHTATVTVSSADAGDVVLNLQGDSI